MSTAIYYLSGKARWAKLKKPDPKYNRWTIDLYLDEDSKPKFAESGMQLELKTDKEGGRYHTFGRSTEKLIKGKVVVFDAPNVIDAEGNPFSKNVGNGSHVTIRVSVYDTAKGKGHRLDTVRVNHLVPYEAQDDMPPVPAEYLQVPVDLNATELPRSGAVSTTVAPF